MLVVHEARPRRLRMPPCPQPGPRPYLLATLPRPQVSLQSNDSAFAGALRTILVLDGRPLTGEDAASPRAATRLPFRDTGDSSAFRDDYDAEPAAPDGAPDVVYRFRPAADMAVTISTCGSSFDTKLLLAQDLRQPATYITNDDDRGCEYNSANSRIDAALRANTSYYVVVDGYAGASGPFVLQMSCTSCAGAPAS
jgi:hypothetical protein